MREWMRPAGIALVVLAIILLAIGFAVSSDFLGLLFMIAVIVGIVMLIADFMLRRRTA